MLSAPRETDNFEHLANQRLSNKAGWNLRAILESAEFARGALTKAMAIAERKLDTELVIHLARLQNDLARIERKAGDALRGEYRDD